MAPTLLLATEDRLLAIHADGRVDEHLKGMDVTSVAVAAGRPERAYAGTDGAGLWRSDDGGQTWDPAAEILKRRDITAVAADGSAVYVGTEPSALFRSNDGGKSWEESTGLHQLPSASEWSFPPRPETHHVRWIALDPVVPGRMFIAIEAGALIRSLDRGHTWQDRTRGSPYDTHTLATHPRAPGRLYSAAGDGYFESLDAGETWTRPRQGLRHSYLVHVVVHPRDPNMILISAASGPRAAYAARGAESCLYRNEGGGRWEAVHDGLPEARGTTVSALAVSIAAPGVAYAANNQGTFRSADFGVTWQRLDIPWPGDMRAQHVRALALIEGASQQ